MSSFHGFIDNLTDATIAALAILVLIGFLAHLPAKFLEKFSEGRLGQSRYASLDGLRGFLALWVVLTHLWSYYDRYYRGIIWDWPSNPYFNQCGNIAVPLFLMITGFLFWGKAIRAKGRINTIALYLNRARRVLPLYYFLCVVVVVISLWISKEPWVMQQKTLGQEIVSLIIPGRQFMGPIAGVERFFLITPTWTLYFEVIFYLLLPILALSAFSFLSSGVFLIISLFGLLIPWSQMHPYFYMGFWVGALVAEIVERGKLNLTIFKDTYSNYFILGSIILVPLLTGGELNTFSFSVASVVFFFVICGNTCFELLLNPGARILGAVSYSIYIIHMPLLYVSLMAYNYYFPLAKLSTLEYAPFCIGFVFLVVLISMATFRLIEKPCMVMGVAKTTQAKS